MIKKKIIWDLPLQIGVFVYQYAKLRMLQFYYDFLDVFVSRDDFELCEMDTDSLYMGLSGASLDDVVIPEKRREFYTQYSQFLQVLSCKDHEQEFIDTKMNGATWVMRECCGMAHKRSRFTPGLFKVEHNGDGIIALCSKTYIAYTLNHNKQLPDADTEIPAEINVKLSCKGLNKHINHLTSEKFHSVLVSQQRGGGVNKGFRVRGDGVYEYEQHRQALSYLYIKRKVLSDGISTIPLDI